MTDEPTLFPDEKALTDGYVVPLGWKAGDVGRCRSCGQEVMWATTPNEKRAPLNRDGTSHFSNCPEAAKWRKRA